MSQIEQWQKGFRNTIRYRKTKEMLQLIQQNPKREATMQFLRENTIIRKKKHLLTYILIMNTFSSRPELTQKDYNFVHKILEYYFMYYRHHVDESSVLRALIMWKDTSRAADLIRQLKQWGFPIPGDYLHRYIQRYLPYYKCKYSNSFDFKVFQELYGPQNSQEKKKVLMLIPCLPYKDFQKCLAFLMEKNIYDFHFPVFASYFKLCPNDAQYRQKLDLLLEAGFHLPDNSILSLCQRKDVDFQRLSGILQYFLDKGVRHDTELMTMALMEVIKHSRRDAYELGRQQKQEPDPQKRQSLRQSIKVENDILRTIRFLCENGADVLRRDNDGKTAVDLAIQKKAREILNLLLYYVKNQKLQTQVLSRFPERPSSQKVKEMKQDVQGRVGFLSAQETPMSPSKRMFHSPDLSKQLSSFLMKPQTKIEKQHQSAHKQSTIST